MGYGIPAAEFLGICILMADFDLQTDALQVVNRLEEFQREAHRRFGTSDGISEVMISIKILAVLKASGIRKTA